MAFDERETKKAPPHPRGYTSLSRNDRDFIFSERSRGTSVSLRESAGRDDDGGAEREEGRGDTVEFRRENFVFAREGKVGD